MPKRPSLSRIMRHFVPLGFSEIPDVRGVHVSMYVYVGHVMLSVLVAQAVAAPVFVYLPF
jgi:hypothetical protein